MTNLLADTENLLTQDEISTAIELLIARMDAIDAHCANGFPLYSPARSDRWVVSPGGSWVGGFWAGWWWLRARVTESSADRRRASQICQRLASKVNVASINRSMIFRYGAVLGDVWFGDEGAHRMAKESADALAASYLPAMQCIPLGTDMGGGAHGGRRIGLDTLASVIDLLNYSNHPQADEIARQHVDIMHAACAGGKGAYHSHAKYENGSFQAGGRAGAWSRGQAWSMLGLSRAAAQWGEPYIARARSACEYWLRSRPQSAAPNDINQVSGPVDLSATLIAALAMYALAGSVPGETHWHDHAQRLIANVVRSTYLIGLRGKGDGISQGIFWGASYETRPGTPELVESPWGSFFLMAALCILAGAINPVDC